MPLLLPTDKLGRTPTTTEIVAELGVWGLTGAIVHSVAQGIQQKPIFARPHLLGIWTAVFVGIGYGAQQFETSMLNTLQHERDRLVKRRARFEEQGI